MNAGDARRRPMMARYDGEKLNDYVIEGLAVRASPGDSALFRRVIYCSAYRVNSSGSSHTRITARIAEQRERERENIYNREGCGLNRAESIKFSRMPCIRTIKIKICCTTTIYIALVCSFFRDNNVQRCMLGSTRVQGSAKSHSSPNC